MALERTLPIWTARLRVADDTWAGTLVIGGSFEWLGASSPAIADRVRAATQRRLDEGGPPSAPLAALPELESVVPELVPVALPRRVGVHEAITLELPILLCRAREGAWLAVSPGLKISWPGATPEEAREGLRQRAVLELLARDDLGSGDPLLAIVQVRAIEAVREERTFSFPTFAEVREADKARDRILEKVTRPFRTGPRGAFELERELDALGHAVHADRSVLVVGAHGSGKTELVRELVRARWPNAGRPIREVDAPGLLLALMDTGEGWQQGLSRLVVELAAQKGWLYVGNLAELFEVGRYVGNETSLAEHLRPALARGDMRLIAECTPEELAAIEARYPGNIEAFARVAVPIGAASLDAVVTAWAAARGPELRARFAPDALQELLRLHRRFAPYSGFPGKTLRFLDAMASEADRQGDPLAIVDITRGAVLDRFCAESGLPRALVDPLAPLPQAEIRSFFEAHVYGQPVAVEALVDTLSAVKADVARWGRPLASLLLAGPTGVGKTETARATAAFLFGSATRMTRFDMSEYATPGAVARLVGGPSGEGLLTGAVRRQPFSVLLFDELEKAHPAFLDLLLQVLGEGRLTDGRGRTADFSSAVVLMTSNVGAVEARRGASGFARDGAGDREGRYKDAVAAWLRPELQNRIDRVLAYSSLGPASIERVLDRELDRFRTRPGLAGVAFEVTPAARAVLARAGFHPAWGARQLLRVVHDRLAAPIAAALDGWRDKVPPRVHVDANGEAITIRLSAGERAPVDETGDLAYLRARALQRRLRDVEEGSVYAERGAQLQAVERQRARNPAAWTENPVALRDLLGDVRALTQEARDVERLAGTAALHGRADPAVIEMITRLEAEALRRGRALLQASRPTGSICVVAVYGRDEVHSLVGLYTRAAKAFGLTVEPATLHLDPNETFHLDLPGVERPKDLGAALGVELRVTGPAALWLFLSEPGVTTFAGTGRNAEGRVRVELFEGDRAAWEQRRPKELARKHYFADTPRRVVGDRIDDRAERWSVSDLAALERRLGVRYTERVFEALL